jgi:hypothetical protein
MVGWNARGANGFAIDPSNAHRAIGIAANSGNWNDHSQPSPHGLYLTTNQAASWTQVLALDGAFDGQVEFDPTSESKADGHCLTAYYFSGEQEFFRSDDGGATWHRLASAPKPGQHAGGNWDEGLQIQPRLAVNPKTGAVYLGGELGLFCSEDGGRTWKCSRSASVYSLAMAPDGSVYISDPGNVMVSADNGKTWQACAGIGLDTIGGRRIQNLVISPADGRRLICWLSGKGFNWPRYYSHDGGAHWQPITRSPDGAPLPMNGRQGYATWSPGDPAIAWTIGGDWVLKSTDGAANFHWSNNGYNGIMLGGLFNFSAFTPDIVYLGFQDYNGAFTTNGGQTWNYRDVSGKGWGGHQYGAFALNPKVMWSGDADSWGAARHLRLTRDGGKTWGYANGADGKPLELHRSDVSCGDPTAVEVGFAANYRTADAGATWQGMPGCDGVFTTEPERHALYGLHDQTVVKSTDHGLTWISQVEVPGGAVDLAVDARSNTIYAASEDHLKAWHDGKWETIETPGDQYGRQTVRTVAVDPQDPAIIYVGGPRNTYASQATVCRSTDGGKTWRNLTVTSALGGSVSEGPHEVCAIRVHPATHEAWVAGQCFGLWRIGPPEAGELGLPAAAASAPPALHISQQP